MKETHIRKINYCLFLLRWEQQMIVGTVASSCAPTESSLVALCKKSWDVLISSSMSLPSYNSLSLAVVNRESCVFKCWCNLRERLVHSDTREPPYSVSWLPNQSKGFFLLLWTLCPMFSLLRHHMLFMLTLSICWNIHVRFMLVEIQYL